MRMGYPTRIQVIKRAKAGSRQFYVCFPMALARAMDFEPSEVVEWVIERDGKLVLQRGQKHGTERSRARRKAKGARE